MEVGQGWYLNADVKKIWIDTESRLRQRRYELDVDIDPWIFSVGRRLPLQPVGPVRFARSSRSAEVTTIPLTIPVALYLRPGTMPGLFYLGPA